MARGRKPNVSLADGPRIEQGGRTRLEPPPGLGPQALAVWADLEPEISARCALVPSDRYALGFLCVSLARWLRAARETEDADLLIRGPNGAPYANPLFSVEKEALAALLKLSDRFGFDPISRLRMGVGAEAKGPNKVIEFLSRKAKRAAAD